MTNPAKGESEPYPPFSELLDADWPAIKLSLDVLSLLKCKSLQVALRSYNGTSSVPIGVEVSDSWRLRKFRWRPNIIIHRLVLAIPP